MSRPRDIRKDLIKPNLVELQGFGILRETPANSGKRGRPALVYYLNEEQALLLCMFSRTEKAQAVRTRRLIQQTEGDPDQNRDAHRVGDTPWKCASREDRNRSVKPPPELVSEVLPTSHRV